jgi:CheY-like chemotaxis protein
MANVLVIDDEPLIRQMARRILERRGHRILEAANGAIGLAQLEENAVDLVLTDIMMPEKERVGDSMPTLLSKREGRRDVRKSFFVLSGGGNKFGAHAAMSKPFRPDD